jgi:hypothetical protein
MKTKNPLYVVKGKDVLEASSILDLVIKKLNLEPVIQVLQNILKMILEQVKTWETFIAAKKFVDEWIAQIIVLAQRFGVV